MLVLLSRGETIDCETLEDIYWPKAIGYQEQNPIQYNATALQQSSHMLGPSDLGMTSIILGMASIEKQYLY